MHDPKDIVSVAIVAALAAGLAVFAVALWKCFWLAAQFAM